MVHFLATEGNFCILYFIQQTASKYVQSGNLFIFVLLILVFIFFFLFGVLQPVKIISLILSQVNHEVGRKREIIEKKHLTTHKQNLACLKSDPS